jgi:polyisoprenoid-binding protein YceI
VAGIDTDNENRDNHLKNPDFFDVEKYPEITFTGTKIEKTTDGLIMHGDLTMHGVTKPVSFPFVVNGPITDPWGKMRFGAEANLTINRQDYGVSWSKTLDAGGLVVDNDVKINIQIEMVKAE